MDHILSHIAAREIPEQSPVDKLIGIEWTLRPPVQKGVPLNVCRRAVRRNCPHPLRLASRRVAAHPRFHMSDLTDQTILYPLFGVCQVPRALMLKPDAHD